MSRANGTADGCLDADGVDHARTIVRLALGRPVDRRTLLALPAAPVDFSGLANMLHNSPDITRRAELVRRWVESQGRLTAAAAGVLRRAFHRLEAGPVDDDRDDEAEAGPRPFDLGILDVATFVGRDYPREYLINGIVVKGRPGVIGGPQKALKTTLAVDLVVSAASATRFLDTFEVPKVVRTLLISGESGEATIQETVRRVCRSRRIDPAEMASTLFVGFTLPQLSDPGQLEALADFIRESGIELVVVDPLYLCLIGAGSRIDPSNLFDVGPLLKTITQTCLDAGATPLLLHHFRKNRESPYGPPEMEDLAFAGIQEFARQWLLIGRRERYEPGSGEHRLWLSVGGSDGHSGSWAVDVAEGTVGDEFRDREWKVAVSRACEARDEARQQAVQARVEREAEKARTKAEAREREDAEATAALIVCLEGEPGRKATLRRIRDVTGWNPDKARRIVAQAEKMGVLRPATVPVAMPRGGPKDYAGFELVGDSEEAL
jgi:hypothetical protein